MICTEPQHEAAVNQWTWKTLSMRDMALAVCRLALQRGSNGEFSALDLPVHGAHDQGGTGIAGTIFRQLKDAGIIARVGVFVDGKFYPKNVVNAGGNPVGVYRLAHPGLARALIRAHSPGEIPSAHQLSLFKERMPA